VRNRYFALDKDGKEYEREALLVHELPHIQRLLAVKKLVPILESILQLKVNQSIGVKFGIKIYVAFNLSLCQAKAHAESHLLLRSGGDLPLKLLSNINEQGLQ